MESYIVRIYRRHKNDRRMLVGLVEQVGRSGRKAFNTLDDLWEILNPKKQRSRTGRGSCSVRSAVRRSKC